MRLRSFGRGGAVPGGRCRSPPGAYIQILESELTSADHTLADMGRHLADVCEKHGIEVQAWSQRVDALQLTVAQLREVATADTFRFWSAAMLEDETGLGRIVRELTGMPNAKAFRLFYYNVFDRKGSRRVDLQGIQVRLDIFYGPRHRPGQDDWAGPSTADNIRGEPNTCRLDRPIDQCFLALCTLRLGLSNHTAAALFGISQLNTWLPFISVTRHAHSLCAVAISGQGEGHLAEYMLINCYKVKVIYKS
mmetsp:Transcript_22535/g.57969  ORF Transcript_22535/g.57969 Transcript_22535/m.57969 type:complete len:250 (+) Transcript_22535:885-1634(+)